VYYNINSNAIAQHTNEIATAESSRVNVHDEAQMSCCDVYTAYAVFVFLYGETAKKIDSMTRVPVP
jgi:hypothetical protein